MLSEYTEMQRLIDHFRQISNFEMDEILKYYSDLQFALTIES